jgi:hypothetical protein
MDEYRATFLPSSDPEADFEMYERPAHRFVVPVWLQIALLLTMFALGWLLFEAVRQSY